MTALACVAAFCLSEANVSTSIQVDSTARGSAAAWAVLPVCEWRLTPLLLLSIGDRSISECRGEMGTDVSSPGRAQLRRSDLFEGTMRNLDLLMAAEPTGCPLLSAPGHGSSRWLPDVAKLAAEEPEEHELWQPGLSEDHRRRPQHWYHPTRCQRRTHVSRGAYVEHLIYYFLFSNQNELSESWAQLLLLIPSNSGLEEADAAVDLCSQPGCPD